MDKESNSFSQLNDIFDVKQYPIAEPIVIRDPSNVPLVRATDIEENSDDEDDSVFIKTRLKNLINTADNFLDTAISVASSTQDAKDMDIVLKAIKTQSDLLAKLSANQKKSSKDDDSAPGSTVVKNSQVVVVSGTTKDVLKLLDSNKKPE